MKKFIIIITLVGFKYSHAQTLYNDTSNTSNQYFYEMLKTSTKLKKVEQLLYYTHYFYGYKMIFNKGPVNYLSNKNDSTTILSFMVSSDSIYNLNYLISLVKNKKAILYDYNNPKIIYDDKNIHLLVMYPRADTFKSILNNGKEFVQIIGHYDDYDTTMSNNQDQGLSYQAFFEIDNKREKSHISMLAVSAFIPIYDSRTGDFLGSKGVGCFVFKMKLVVQ